MPGNWGYLGEDVKNYLCNNFSKDCSILDIGCGHGFYYKLLSHYFNVFDAVEIWQPYIQEYELTKMYRNVFNTDIINFEFDYYDIIIMGDVLEHLSRNDAVVLLDKIKNKCKELIVVVPYYLPQGEVLGNQYEIHLQPDLSDVIMKEYYPDLELITLNNKELKIPVHVGDNYYYYCAFRKKR